MPENHNVYQERLSALRAEMEKQGLDGFVLPRTDEYQGEFLASYAERLAWLTGFTGSAGVAVILKDKAVVMSDGRYTIQLARQVDTALYDMADSTQTSVGQWLSEHAMAGSRIGFDPWLHTQGQVDKLCDDIAGRDLGVSAVKGNLVDAVWAEQPARPLQAVMAFPHEVAGMTSEEKRAELASVLRENGAKACVLSAGDSICWLLNVRGHDIEYSPLMLSYGVLYDDGAFDWYIEPDQVSDDVLVHVGAEVAVYPEKRLLEDLSHIDGAVAIDPHLTPLALVGAIKDPVDAVDPCVHPKSIKSTAEKKVIRAAHVIDGVAIVKFLHWLDTSPEEKDELSVEAKLEAFRAESDEYLGASFSTIAGFNENGAIIHYRATPATNKAINGDGVLLVDSGGQYRWGTTDITRTILIGDAEAIHEDVKDRYTRVLKGHIALASARFECGARGKDIDELARGSLQDIGLNYAHGTGHGVGCYLCVHEDAANISPRGEKMLEEGMLISNEPGYYEEGAYGIRLENLVLVQEGSARDELCFETVTLAPFDPRLIDLSMLTQEETAWLSSYSRAVCDKLAPHLSDDVRDWLEEFIAPLCTSQDGI